MQSTDERTLFSPSRLHLHIVPRQGDALPELRHGRVTVHVDALFADVMHMVRKRLCLGADKALFFFVGNGIVTPTTAVRDLHARHADDMRVLTVHYAQENAFG